MKILATGRAGYIGSIVSEELLKRDYEVVVLDNLHLIPSVLKAALDRDKPVPIFGTDYPTRDGSCIRDYVHVVDSARAHALALEKLGPLSGTCYNLGNEEGFSVSEVVEATRKVTGRDTLCQAHPRHPGDPAVLVASSGLAREELGWRPKHTQLEDITESARRWTQEHRNGYGR
jgi:UDP-glucose 4-epimerase